MTATAPRHPDFEARQAIQEQVERQARLDWRDENDFSAQWAHDSRLYYAYRATQDRLLARMKRGDHDGYEF